ncbi:hypothetical protein [Paracoccus binzhouensis]|uniref:hypothetical protein n=1 Tax=Paracoccus binzhouensis TaxID=2796149 RepID=UPI0018EF2EEC|nr:hypothetical protein [Paracoccus binzhouensis]
MPNKATVRGVLIDANLAPIAGGKIVATLNGAGVLEDGVRMVTQKVEATTDAQGAWSRPLIVNAEGAAAGTSWTIEGYDPCIAKVFELKSLFIATPRPITLADLEKTSAQSLRAARESDAARLIVAASHDEYETLPAERKRSNDIVLIKAA